MLTFLCEGLLILELIFCLILDEYGTTQAQQRTSRTRTRYIFFGQQLQLFNLYSNTMDSKTVALCQFSLFGSFQVVDYCTYASWVDQGRRKQGTMIKRARDTQPKVGMALV